MTDKTNRFAGLTIGGASYNAEQGREIIQYAQRHHMTMRRAAELLAEINGWPRPRHFKEMGGVVNNLPPTPWSRRALPPRARSAMTMTSMGDSDLINVRPDSKR